MRPIAPRYFGPDGLPCVFTSDDETGATTVGYLVQDVGLTRFKVSDGTITRIVRLAQNLDDVSDLSHFPPATMTILLTLEDSSVEHIRYITSCRCSTLEGTSRQWIPTGDPTGQTGVISAPVDDSDDDILMEDGSFWLLEDGSKWKMEPLPPPGNGFVLEQGGRWLLENGTKWELEA
jgi:hypothetical protein